MYLQGGAMARGDRNSVTYERVTRGIRVSVSPTFLEDQSDPEEPRYVWAYTVRINNESDTPVQLRTRYWRITDSRGQTDIVAGDGVVGEQPLIRPGEGFEYTSGAPLAAPSGIMGGTYDLEGEDGRVLIATIPMFSLDSPYETSLPS